MKFLSTLSLGAVALALAPVFTQAEEPAAPKMAAMEATMSGGASLHPRYKMETTLGDIVLELDAEKAPVSALNFDTYATESFYTGTVFHRVMPGFMIQGGGFTEALDEKKGNHPPIENEWWDGLKNDRGTISMARTNAPDSATSQFFINVVDNKMLDMPNNGAAYAVFGKVVEGMDTVDKIKDAKVTENSKIPSREGPTIPETAVVIKSVKAITPLDTAGAKKAIEDRKAMLTAPIEKVIEHMEKEYGGKAEAMKSGLASIVLKKGTGDKHPTAADTVCANYLGKLANGKPFDSSAWHGGVPLAFPLSGVIAGWTEGIPLMVEGEKRLLIIPSDIAYGPGGRPGTIPPNSILVFEVELVKIGECN
ncbi:hypothetical protein BH09SUM1_BH09SUM1_33120 [soil metagenome]